MNDIQVIQDFFTAQVVQASIFGFIFNLTLAALFSYWLGLVYIKHGESLSNRRAFAKNFLLVTLTTLLVISIVKSSLALSLGLIGALSIVRFRAAIKEPEELSYLFLAIAIGLGFGANQRLTTIVAVITIVGILHFRTVMARSDTTTWKQDTYLTIKTARPDLLNLEGVDAVLKEYCSSFRMKRLDKTESIMEAVYLVEQVGNEVLQIIDMELRKVDDQIKVTFLDAK